LHTGYKNTINKSNVFENAADDYDVETPDRFDADSGVYSEDYDYGQYGNELVSPSEVAQLRRYMELIRAVEQLEEPAYVPVIYRGVKGIFVPETSIASKHGGLYRQTASPSLPFTV